MTQDNRLSVLDIARELNTGTATIKFLLKRFKTYLPFELINGQPLYHVNTITLLIMIQEKLEMGLLPSEIEDILKTRNSEETSSLESSLKNIAENSDIRLSHDGLHMLKSLFNDIGKQQERIAAAHEKRAEVEERKALAIEKRAQAEEKKAEAMNNIAAALQEMNKLRSSDAAAQQIAHQTGTVILTDESDEPYKLDNLSELISDSEKIDDTDLSALLDEEYTRPEDSIDDALTDETDTGLDTEFEQELEDSLDDPLKDFDEDLLDEDLSSLDEEDSTSEAIENDQLELDDLSLLIDKPEKETQTEDMELDDLSKLIETPEDFKTGDAEKEASPELDNLSLLIDPVIDHETEKPSKSSENQLDDLSALIDEKPEKKPEPTQAMELDDLSKLIDAPGDSKTGDAEKEASPELDNLSLLIDPVIDHETEKPSESSENQLDDLSALIDEEPEKEDAPVISIDLRPEDDLVKYKAAVTKIIIELKAGGLTVEETTDRLNKNNIKTLSGKSQWGQKAITQIYKFIDSAK